MIAKLPKITKPVFDGVVQRDRLFRKLDSAIRKHQIVWLGAPAGSGKTTLAASWIEVRNLKCLWYRIDSRDADPATFFYFMRESIQRMVPELKDPLPLLTPEYALGLDAYVRNFFEQAGAQLQERSIMVLDNYQELAEPSPLQQLLPVALEALPDNVCVLILSRESPPPPFVRLFAERRLSLIDAADLNLTCSETLALSRVRGHSPLTSESAATLHAATGGWLAGTVLLLETNVQTSFETIASDLSARQIIFDYFAAEILDRTLPSIQHFLLVTAHLPQMSPQTATVLTGEEHSAEILVDLQRRNYFTFRLEGAEPCYEYHPLFRDFLLSRARQTFTIERLRDISMKSVKILLQTGHLEDAAVLLAENGNYDQLSELIVEQAPELVRLGRLGELGTWIGALPEEVLMDNPWLSYYLGLARRVASPEEGRSHFEQAYHSFQARGDNSGMLLAWAGCVDTFVYVWDAFAPLDPWIAAMDNLHDQDLVFPSQDVECRVVFGMLAGLMWRQPAHPKIGHWLRRAATMVQADIDPELRMHLATYLLFHCIWWSGDYARADILLNRMRPLLSTPDVTPLTQLLWFVMEAAFDARMGESAACFRAVDAGLALAQGTGILILNHQLAMQGIYAGLAVGDLAAAAEYHKKAWQYLRPKERLNLGHFKQAGAWIAISMRDFPRAGDFLQGANELIEASGAALSQSWADLTRAHILIEHDAVSEAVSLLERALDWGRKTANPIIEHHCLLSLAYARKREGDENGALAWLSGGLRIGRERGYKTHPWIGWRKEVMSELATMALDHEIEKSFVIEQIRVLGLKPSAAALSAWPGMTRIHTLGRFEIWIGEERVQFPRKCPRRQIECLQALLALGAGDVHDVTISEALWPDSDGDHALHALETTISRLRKLLGSACTLRHHARRLSLDREFCWTDLNALEILLERGLKTVKGDSEPIGQIKLQTEQILSLYRGPFLPDATEEDVPGVMATRRRLRVQLSRYLRAAGAHLAALGEVPADHYMRRAGDVDPALLKD